MTTAAPPRRSARRDTDDEPAETRTGSIWLRFPSGKIKRRTIECVTAAGIRLELTAFFERYMGRNLRIQVVEPIYADVAVAPAIVSLVAAPIFAAPHGYSQFLRARWRKDGFTPFAYGQTGAVHLAFRPHWYVKPEPPILLKSINGDGFTYPSTDGFDEESVEIDGDSRVDDPEATSKLGLVNRATTIPNGHHTQQARPNLRAFRYLKQLKENEKRNG